MAKNCNIKSPVTGEKSEVYDILVKIAKEENFAFEDQVSAHEYWAYLQSPEFKEDFGDWEVPSDTMSERVLASKEPNIFWDKDSKGYFYYNKYNTLTPFPPNEKGLNEFFTDDTVTAIVHHLAYVAFKKHFGEDFSETDILSDPSFNLLTIVRDYLESIKDDYGHIEILLDYQQELNKLIKNYYNELGLIYYHDTGFETQGEQERTLKRQSSLEKSAKDTVTANVKLKLAFLPSEERDGILGERKFQPWDEVYKFLQSQLSDIYPPTVEGKVTDIFDVMLDQIKDMSTQKPYLKRLVEMLESPNFNDHQKSEFVQAFDLTNVNLYVSNVGGEKGVTSYKVMNVSKVNSKEKILLNEWGLNFRDIFVSDSKLDKEKILAIWNRLGELDSGDNTGLYEILFDLGVEIPKQSFDFYLNNNNYASEIDAEDKVKVFTKTVDDTRRLLSELYNDEISVYRKGIYNNPLRRQSVFNKMAHSDSFFFDDASDNTVYSGGKNMWIFSNPTYVSRVLNAFKADPSNIRTKYNEPFNQSSRILRYLLADDKEFFTEEAKQAESDRRVSNVEMGIFNVLQEEGKSSQAINNADMQYIDSVKDSMNKILGFKLKRKVYYPTPTPAEKNTKIEISTGYSVDTNSRIQDNKLQLNQEISDIFWGYWKAEYERAIRAANDLETLEPHELVMYYHTDKDGNINTEEGKLAGNAFKSQIFPSLNENKDGLMLFNEVGAPIVKNIDSLRDKIQPYIDRALRNKIVQTYQELKRIDIFKENATLADGLDLAIGLQYEKHHQPFPHIAADYAINGLISQIEYTKLFSGDVAYYRDMADYMKRIPGTYTDGMYLRIGVTEGDGMFNVAAMENVTKEGFDLESLPLSIREYYKNVNTTDAQAWITPERWRFIIDRVGKWSPAHDTLYDKMKGINNEALTLKEFKIAAQPLKGVYFDTVDGKPVYLKYSQAVLMPGLIKGSELETIFDKMTKDENGNELPYNDQIHELVVLDGIKVGSTALNKWDSKKFNTMKLWNKGWKLQQDLPTKGFSQIAVGTQIQKVAMAGLAQENLVADFNGQTGLETFDELNNIQGRLSDIGLNEFKSELGIGEDGVITNTKGYYKLLIKELRRRGDEENLIKALEKNLSPFAIPQAVNKLLNIFSSIITKRTVNIETNGGAFIQVSDFGLSKGLSQDRGIKWFIDPETGLKRPRIEKTQIKLKDGTTKVVKMVRPGQILLPASLIAKIIPNYKELSGAEILERIDPRILEGVVGYRIPNQGMSSNDALEVVGILPEEMGDSIVAYSEITMKTGSDFDIDKMYIMMPNFEDVDGKLSYIEFDKTKPLNKQPKLAVQNRLIELYHNIFSHPNNFEDVMRPVDAKDIRDNIKSLYHEKLGGDLDSFDILKQIKIKQDFVGGQAGVGQTANSLMDHIRGMFAKQSVYNFNLNEFGAHTNSNGFLELDQEYSKATRYGPKPMKIAHSLSAFLNAFVDIAKDDYVVKGNYNTVTTNPAFLMIRGGVHPFIVNAFVAQPIIKTFVENLRITEGLLSSNKYMDPVKETINKYWKSDEKIPDVSNSIYSYKNLTKSAIEEYPDPAAQVAILSKFIDIMAMSKLLNKAVLSQSFDVDGPGKDLTDRLITENKITSVLQDINDSVTGSILNYGEKYNSTLTGNKTFASHYYRNGVHFVKQVAQANPRLFLLGSNSVEEAFNQVSKDLGKGLLVSNKLGNELTSSMYAYIMSGFKPLQIDSVTEVLTDLADEIKEYKKNNKDNFFTNKLEIKSDANFDFVGINNRYKPKTFKDRMYKGWKELWENNPELANKLVKYAFHQSGFKNNISQIFTYIPHEWFIVNRLDNYIIEKSMEIQDSLFEQFQDQFYRNNWDNKMIVPPVFEKFPSQSNISQAFIRTTQNEQQPKFVTMGESLYKLVGYTEDGHGKFIRTHKLGYKTKVGSVIEYSYGNKLNYSQFSSNNVDVKAIEKASNSIEAIRWKNYPQKYGDKADILSLIEPVEVTPRPTTNIDINKLPDCL